MGGYGSGKGRRQKRHKKPNEYAFPCINVSDLIHKLVKWGEDSFINEHGLKFTLGESLDVKPISREFPATSLKFVSMPCNYGGFRYFGCCPCCQKRVKNLYLYKDLFACRHCLKIAYLSQNQTLYSRLLFKEKRINEKLEDGKWTKPKWMRRKTFERLRGLAFDLENMMDFAEMFSLKNNYAAKALLDRYGDACVVPEETFEFYGETWEGALKYQAN